MTRFRVKPKPSASKKTAGVARSPKARRLTKTSPHDRLVALVKESIKKAPFSYDRHKWAAQSQEWWGQKVGVSVRTLRDMLKEKHFVTTRAHVDGVVCCLIRIGTKGPPSEKELQKELANIWRNRNYWPNQRGLIPEREYGCLLGLVQNWGREAPKVFVFILDHWPDFMLMIKAEKDGPGMYLSKPSIVMILIFSDIACEMYQNADNQ